MEANDMKAMREALVKMTDWMEKYTAAFSVQVYPRQDDHDEVERERDEAISLARAALAKPQRNCDVGTAAEQAERFVKHCQSFLNRDGIKACMGCPCCGVVMYGKCELAWAQMPYEEGDAK